MISFHMEEPRFLLPAPDIMNISNELGSNQETLEASKLSICITINSPLELQRGLNSILLFQESLVVDLLNPECRLEARMMRPHKQII